MRRFTSGRAQHPLGRLMRLVAGACLLGLVLPAAVILLPAARSVFANPTTVSGLVFRDYNDDGVRDAREPPVAGIAVTVFMADGTSVGGTTDAAGAYTVSVPVAAGTRVRVEFAAPVGGFQSSSFGSTSGTTVQFAVTPAANINLGILRPAQYCQAAAQLNLATSCYVYGDQTSGDGVLVDFPYQAGRNPPFAADDQPTAHGLMVPDTLVGTTWGLAYQRSTNTLFAGAFFKRHSGLGPGGLGTIYRVNPSVANGAATPFLDMNALFPGSAGTSPRAGVYTNNDYFSDSFAFDKVGKIGLGDVEMGEDDQTLYVVALGDRRVYEIPIGAGPTAPGAAAIRHFTIPTPTGANACPLDPATPVGQPNLNLRPFGLGVYDGRVYLGVVCTGESTQNRADMRAYVFSIDPATAANGAAFDATPALTFPLTFARGCLEVNGVGCLANSSADWNPWRVNFNDAAPWIPFDATTEEGIEPQPWLTTIEFDNGAMILAFRDRYGDQMGNRAGAPGQAVGVNPLYIGIGGGDLMRACATAPGQWTIEGAGGCPTNADTTVGRGLPEFFNEDNHQFHDEVGGGSVVQVPGYPELAAVMNDPIKTRTFEGGLRWFSNTTGALSWGYKLFGAVTPAGNALFGKTNGIGDLEALCQSAPVEIGNLVWYDVDLDGIQDPDEAPVVGVTLTLFDAGGNPVATAKTNARGEYYFRGGPLTGDADPNDFIGQLTGPMGFNTVYQIRFTNSADFAPGGPLDGWFLTRWDQGPSRVRDSNGRAATPSAQFPNGQVFADVLTGRAGENNHTFDFGFNQSPTRIQLESFSAQRTDTNVEVSWSTGAEVNTWGFYLYRGVNGDRSSAVRVTPHMIAAQGRGRGGASYLWVDQGALPGVSYSYWLQEVELSGAVTEYGPASSTQTSATRHRLFMPFVRQ